jgi:hydrogenase maturation factor
VDRSARRVRHAGAGAAVPRLRGASCGVCAHPYSKNAAIIGEVTEEMAGKVVMTTAVGAQTLLPQPGGELLPRIC